MIHTAYFKYLTTHNLAHRISSYVLLSAVGVWGRIDASFGPAKYLARCVPCRSRTFWLLTLEKYSGTLSGGRVQGDGWAIERGCCWFHHHALLPIDHICTECHTITWLYNISSSFCSFMHIHSHQLEELCGNAEEGQRESSKILLKYVSLNCPEQRCPVPNHSGWSVKHGW